MENDKATNIYKWGLFTNNFFPDTYIVFSVLRFSLPDTYMFLLSKIHVSTMGIKTLCMCVYLYIYIYISAYVCIYLSRKLPWKFKTLLEEWLWAHCEFLMIKNRWDWLLTQCETGGKCLQIFRPGVEQLSQPQYPGLIRVKEPGWWTQGKVYAKKWNQPSNYLITERKISLLKGDVLNELKNRDILVSVGFN